MSTIMVDISTVNALQMTVFTYVTMNYAISIVEYFKIFFRTCWIVNHSDITCV